MAVQRSWWRALWPRRRWVAGLVLATLGVSAVQAERLVIYGDDAYPPVVHNVDGKPVGILVDLLRRAEAYSGDQYELRLVPWARAYENARHGQGGVIGVSLTSERAQQFDFSRPVYDDDIRVVARKGHEFAFKELADLRGKVVGGVIGASYGEKVDQAIAQGLFTVERDVGQTNRLRKLLAGRLDAAFIGNGVAGFELVLQSHPELLANRDQLLLLPKPLAVDPLHLAFAKEMKKAAALARFDVAMERVRKDVATKR